MKPIGNNSGIDASPACQPDGQEVTAPGSSLPHAVTSLCPDQEASADQHETRLHGELSEKTSARVRSISSVRLEDIVGVAPKSVTTPSVSNSPDVDSRFADLLRKNTGGCEHADNLIRAAASTLRSHGGFEFVGLYTPSGGLIGQPDRIEGLTDSFDSLPVSVQQAIQDVIHQPEPQHAAGRSTGAARVDISGTQLSLLGFVPGYGSNGLPVSQRCAIEMTGAVIAEWHLKKDIQQTEADVRHIAAIVELTGRVSGSAGTEVAAKCIAEDLSNYLEAADVFVGLCPTEGASCRLTAISGTEVDPLNGTTQLAEAVLMESIARGMVSVWPAQEAADRHALLAHQQFAKEHGYGSVVACPLRFEADKVAGAILVTFQKEAADGTAETNAATFLRAAERPLASALESLQRSSHGILSQLTAGVRAALRDRRLKVAALVVAALSGVMMLPVDYRVGCESELQPVSRRFVAAPFDAPLDECLVEPGDVVEADQPVARLDGRELRWELAGVHADLSKATKERNSFLSEQKSAQAAIARHEIERLSNQVALLSDRMRNLEIRSPVDGIIVTGDLKETEGVPLETGQTLFEIAPLDRMVIEAAIPEEDIRHVRKGMEVRLILDSMPSELITATISKVHPRAELRDNENVFIAEAEISNSERLLRPGMRGAAKISTGRRALGWTLFHKPTARVTGWLGW